MQEFRHLSHIYTCAYIHYNGYQFQATWKKIVRVQLLWARTITQPHITVPASVGTQCGQWPLTMKIYTCSSYHALLWHQKHNTAWQLSLRCSWIRVVSAESLCQEGTHLLYPTVTHSTTPQLLTVSCNMLASVSSYPPQLFEGRQEWTYID